MNNNLLYKKISEDILSLIESGELLPGDKIPSVSELKEKYKVSHLTVLRAYKDMQETDRIKQKRGCGYFVKSNGRSQGTQTGNIGVMIRSLAPFSSTDNFFNDITYGIHDECCASNLNLITIYTSKLFRPYNKDLPDNILSDIAATAEQIAPTVDGFLFDERLPDDTISRIIKATGKNAVLINRTPQIDIDAVIPNNKAAMQLLTSTAYKMGYRKFIFCDHGFSSTNADERRESFNTFIVENKITENDFYIIKNFAYKPYRELMDEMLFYTEKFCKAEKTMIIGGFDGSARSCCEELNVKGFKPGKDIGIGGIDWMGCAKNFKPLLTSIDTQPEQIGRLAVKKLLSRINNETQEKYSTISPEIILRWGETI